MVLGNNFGKTIQLFLVDGTPTGLRKATIHGWTGVVIVSSQSNFAKLTDRDEVDRTGVYILVGSDPDQAGATRVYIGAANSVRERIKRSATDRPFWETAIAVTTSDDDLSKGHAEYLEARLIELTAQSGRVTLDNETQPDTSRRRLPEADVANMEQFLGNLQVILPVVGTDMLKPQPSAVTKSSSNESLDEVQQAKFEIRHKTGIRATAVEEDGEFVVLEGSEALTSTGYVQNTYGGLKEQLVADGVLVESGEGQLRFARSWPFKSPSAAAAVVLDRSSNGRTEWKVMNSKKTYHEWQVEAD